MGLILFFLLLLLSIFEMALNWFINWVKSIFLFCLNNEKYLMHFYLLSHLILKKILKEYKNIS